MLKDKNQKLLEELLASLSKEELIWTNGYLSGLLKGENIVDFSDVSEAKMVENVTVIYATDTGNSKYIAGEINKKLKEKSVKVKLKATNQYRLSDLEKEQYAILIISTHGDGEMPESGTDFLKYLKENELDLSKLKYFVVALGDTNYPLFCQAGRDVDERLEELKAKRLQGRVDLDLDFEDHLNDIYNQVISMLTVDGGKKSPATQSLKSAKKKGTHHYIGEVITNVNLNDIGSSKTTHHLEIGVDEELDYGPGDSVGIILEEDDEYLKTLFPDIKEKLAPRFYSIASSLDEHGNEVHLTVALQKDGVCSNYLASLKAGQKVKFYISKNRQFKLPGDDKDIIMVGPGTGIAPFRSFIAQRNYNSASGKNWLFFGERNFVTDFLYQTEWLDYLDSGLLTNLDVAFSRDQKEKIYVQNRMEQKGEELYKWLESGSYFYICGDKERMAKDVENALINIISKCGNHNEEGAKAYLEKLEEEGRYLKDVY